MDPGPSICAPSRTALGAAIHRAAHQVLEHGSVFADPLAQRILGAERERLIAGAAARPATRRLRLFIAVRARFADEALDAALARGASQVVILGAGLDTLAYRRPWPAAVRVFEVDHPATQAWKRRRLDEVGIPVPAALAYAGVDFERDGLDAGLECAGFDARQRTFVTWLGVVPYLSRTALIRTLGWIAQLPGGGEVVFDYANEPRDGGAAAAAQPEDDLADRVARVGEPFRTWLSTPDLHALLRDLGLEAIDDLGPEEIRARYFPEAHAATGGDRGGHIVRATAGGNAIDGG